MGHTLTGLIPSMYAGMDMVARKLTGAIPSVTIDAKTVGAAVGQQITSFKTRTVTSANHSASMVLPTGTTQTVDPVSLTISKAKVVEIPWEGEEFMSLSVGNGVGASNVVAAQFAQAISTLVDEMEADIVNEAYLNASRAYGTAGTTPFGTAGDFQDATNVAKILKDNGSFKFGDASLILDTTAGAKLTGLHSRYDIAGNVDMQNAGVIIDKAGFKIRESAQIPTPDIGTGSSATTNNAGYAIGATDITLASAGTGTIVAGDVITFAGDSNKYVVKTGDTNVGNGGTIVLQEPGLRKAIAASATNITVVAQSTRNIALVRPAITFATRSLALPPGGDAAVARQSITDPFTGITFTISKYVGNHMHVYQVGAAWAVKCWMPKGVAVLLG